MAEITTKENETGEIVIETASKPTVLSEEQKVVFTDLIKTNTPYLQDQISQVKRDFPEEFASVSPFSDSEISEFSDLVSEDFQDHRLKILQKYLPLLSLLKDQCLEA